MTKVRVGSISEVKLDENNANDGTQRGRGMLENSMRTAGAGRSIVLDKNLKAIGGNKTTETAADIGMEEVVFVHTTGKQLVAVVRDDLDLDDPDGEARLLAYYDNRTAEVSLSWNSDVLAKDAAAGLDLSGLFRPRELQKIGVALVTDGEGADAEPQLHRAEELAAEWGVERGQVWGMKPYYKCPKCGKLHWVTK